MDGQRVRTKKRITKESADILKYNGIRMGAEGTVIKTYVQVDFNGKLIMVPQECVEEINGKSPDNYEDGVDWLKNILNIK
jgi:hypothetical protein